MGGRFLGRTVGFDSFASARAITPYAWSIDHAWNVKSAAREALLSTPPDWPHCGNGATAEDSVGCRGIQVSGHAACLAHLPRRKRRRYLARLAPGVDIDHRGTPFTPELLSQLLGALRDPAGAPCLGRALFDWATFADHAVFHGVTFAGDAVFQGATFTRSAFFIRATFARTAWFSGATFGTDAIDTALFGGATFTGDAQFGAATFASSANFVGATFTSDARFDGAIFARDARFDEAVFEGARKLGPLVCGGTVHLDDAVFGAPVTVKIAADKLSLQRTQWASTVALRLRYTEVDLTDAVPEYSVTLAAEPARFTGPLGHPLPEEVLADWDTSVRVTNLSGVNAAHLALMDVDLSVCQFVGAVHLDQLRMEGRITFSRPPEGWHRRIFLPMRWSRRRTLAEEHHWRAAAKDQPIPGHQLSNREWRPGLHHPDRTRTPGPETVAALYRQLRKALEDAKNEPGAADFYYGECEMRRHDKTEGTTRVERALLSVYWALSGYGLRASRALSWLVAAMIATVVVMMLWGIPADAPKPTTIGRQVAAGQTFTLITDTPDPVNPTGPLTGRLTTHRFEKSLRTVVNSVVFRSSGQDLTMAGTYIEIASRFTEPVLLGLAALAIRNRVKR
ncbi:pentapeptide repeat-containing protein [Streptomyces sp. NPDC055722]